MRELGSRTVAWTIVLAVVLGAAAAATESEDAEPPSAEAQAWALLELLEGSWTGAIDGKLGTGTAVRRYQLIAGGKYLMARHESVRLPQEKSPLGDQHQELAVFSFDRQRQKLVLREFMGEGVVVRSPCEIDGMRLVCVAEAVESGPGIRARLTLEITDRYRFRELYELAFPGRELELYFDNEWTRTPRLEVWD